MKLHAPPHTAGSGVGDGLTSGDGVTPGVGVTSGLGVTSGVGDGVGATEGGTDGDALGGTLGGTDGGVLGGTLGLPPQVDEKIWKEPQRLRLLLPPTQTSSTCPQPPAYAAAEA